MHAQGYDLVPAQGRHCTNMTCWLPPYLFHAAPSVECWCAEVKAALGQSSIPVDNAELQLLVRQWPTAEDQTINAAALVSSIEESSCTE